MSRGGYSGDRYRKLQKLRFVQPLLRVGEHFAIICGCEGRTDPVLDSHWRDRGVATSTAATANEYFLNSSGKRGSFSRPPEKIAVRLSPGVEYQLE